MSADDAIIAPDDVFSGNLYVELPGERWEAGQRSVTRSCNALARRFPGIRDAAHAANVTVDQFLLDTMFAHLMPARVSIAALTLQGDEKVNIALRLSGDARPHWPLPRGVALVAKAAWQLKAKSGHPIASPTLSISSFHDGPPGEARPFEASLDITSIQTTRMEPGQARTRNVLTPRLAAVLPAISELTRDRLQDWSDFLEWKRRLIQANREALRFTSRTVGPDERSVVFVSVGPNEDALRQAIGRLSRSDALAAFDVSVSEDEWVFQLPEGEREPRGSDIGKMSRGRSKVEPAGDGGNPAWVDSVTTPISFAFSDDALSSIEASDDPAGAIQRALKRIPDSGFIVQSAVQDFAQLNRQERALRELSDQGGYSPYLARHIFDAAEARVPSSAVTIDRWTNSHLNPAQRSAVEKILSAPDLCLIQGPPGTGKTTVIAEAIAQVTQRNETVLLASQTHTAVDNALSRLPFHPSIRAVRLTSNVNKLSEEGQEFLNERALARYYQSLANAVGELREAAAAESEFATQFGRFTHAADGHLADLQSAESRVVEAASRYRLANDACRATLDTLRDKGVAIPDPREVGQAGSSSELPNEWVAGFGESLPGLKHLLEAALGDAEPGPGPSGLGQRRALEDQLAAVLEKMKTDASLVGEYQRLQAALEEFGEEDSFAPLPIKPLVEYFPQAGEIVAELQDRSFRPLKQRKLRKRAQELIRSIDESITLVGSIADQAATRSDLQRELESAQGALEESRNAVSGFFSSHPQVDFRIPARPDQLESENLRTLLQSLRDANAQRLSEARRSQQESEAWSGIQDDWIADLGSGGVAERDWETLGDDWLAECNVVGVTCNENPRTLDDPGLTNFDLTIIDEVSKATPLELLMPLMRARRAALVGDHRQLPPMFRESQDAEGLTEESSDGVPEELALTPENLKKYEKFVTASLFRAHFASADDSIKERLTVQHRMHPDIMDSVNRFYEGQLASGIKDPDISRAHGLTIIGRGDLPVISPDQHMVWVDTTHDDQGRPWTEPAPNSDRARTNELEARLIARMLRNIDDALARDPANAGKLTEVGIVSMYQAQVRCIRQEINKVIRNEPFKAIKYELNTVVKYQGKEKPIILVSMVRNFGPKASKRRRSSRANVARFEYINVAFSRAQALLVVFGARDTFSPYKVELPPMDVSGSPTLIDVYREICDVVERRGALKQASALGELPPAHAGARRR